MDYKELLKRAKKNMPQTEDRGRLEIPAAVVSSTKRQTTIKNFSSIVKTIRREPSHLAKFLFKELATPGTVSGDELLLQSKISSSIISQRINDYINEFVMCKECGKPDTTLVKKDYFVVIKCEACGAQRTLKNIKS
ncbi:translation initiation factor IF-2 subunit beta [archaeon]|nr:translation initiation factor IF-2 subunit beta [archaeon]